jgi:hypothetical protein
MRRSVNAIRRVYHFQTRLKEITPRNLFSDLLTDFFSQVFLGRFQTRLEEISTPDESA